MYCDEMKHLQTDTLEKKLCSTQLIAKFLICENPISSVPTGQTKSQLEKIQCLSQIYKIL